MWAVGCIFGELLRNEPLFPGRTEADMLERMVRLLGSPSEAIWPVRSPHPLEEMGADYVIKEDYPATTIVSHRS